MTGDAIIIAIVVLWIFCSMISAGIYAYRNANEEGEMVCIVFLAPIALAYQSGKLIREKKEINNVRRYPNRPY